MRRLHIRRFLLLSLLVAAGCSKRAAGTEGAECYPNATCDAGLICLSNLCVRPPPASCQAVGEQLASIELGNYAEPEARAPVVARYRAACETAMVSREEGQCLDSARDRWSAAAQFAPPSGRYER